jgi:hypothetical protein
MQCSEILWRTRGDLPAKIEDSLKGKNIPQEIYEKVWQDGDEVAYLNTIYEFDQRKKDFVQTKAKSKLMAKYGERFGLEDDEVQKELERRTQILEYMLAKNLTTFEDVGKIVYDYYMTPKEQKNAFVAALVKGGKK